LTATHLPDTTNRQIKGKSAHDICGFTVEE